MRYIHTAITFFIIISIFSLFDFLTLNGYIEHNLIRKDKDGKVLNCDTLKKHLSIFPIHIETFHHFEKEFDYSFKQCRYEIDKEKNTWCNNKISKLKVYNIDGFDDDLKTYCNYTQKDFISSYQSQYFETNGNLVLVGGYFKNIDRLGISEPKPLSDNYNIYKLCVLNNNYSYCKYQKNKEDSMKEYEKLISLAKK